MDMESTKGHLNDAFVIEEGKEDSQFHPVPSQDENTGESTVLQEAGQTDNNNRYDHPINLENKSPAVLVRNAFKSYRSRKGTSVVLNGLNMTVQEGSIYSLLGASGCGKTTLLSACVGLKNLDKGEIEIFGQRPGTKKSGVPGRNVGYMPQELALYNELSVKETFTYFGRMYGMSSKQIEESTNFLVNFLALPPSHRRVATLSGGQMRRTSIAVALIHSPPLLILDEPTVGVDPLLRQSIWDHLTKLVAQENTTVVITTHYIEEARQSDTIGLMRHGRLLAEDSPQNLLKSYEATFLEEIVLKLCRQDDSENTNETESNSSASSPSSSIEATDNNNGCQVGRVLHAIAPSAIKQNAEVIMHGVKSRISTLYPMKPQSSHLPQQVAFSDTGNVSLKGVICETEENHKDSVVNHNSFSTSKSIVKNVKMSSSPCLESFDRICAMVWKNTVSLLRNISLLLFMFFMPAVQVIIVCVAIGPDPKGLNFGLVNFDARQNDTNCIIVPGCITQTNYTGSLSCRFLKILEKKGTLNLKMYTNEEDAKTDVEAAKIWGYLLFYDNYTQSMIDRAIFGNHADTESIYGSRIKFRLDQSNLQIFRETSKVFLDSFQEFVKGVSQDCDIDPILTEPPIYFAQPIYGEDSVNFTDFLAPSILLAILFFFPLSGSGLAYIVEKKMGTLSRSLVAGVTTFEIMMAYLIVQLVVLCVQVVLSFLILELVFHIKIAGPIHCAFLLAILVGVAGMSMGFLLAAFLSNELEAMLVALGTFLPNMLLSGLLWPLEGMPLALQYLSQVLPCTFPGEAMRSILSRGVSYTHPSVWPGFLSVIVWIIIYWVLNILLHKYKSTK